MLTIKNNTIIATFGVNLIYVIEWEKKLTSKCIPKCMGIYLGIYPPTNYTL